MDACNYSFQHRMSVASPIHHSIDLNAIFQTFQQTNEQTDLFMLENKMSTTILTHCCFQLSFLSLSLSWLIAFPLDFFFSLSSDRKFSLFIYGYSVVVLSFKIMQNKLCTIHMEFFS